MSQGFFGSTVQKILRNVLHDAEASLAHQISYKVAMYKRKIVKDMISLAIVFVAIIFLAVAFTYLFIEYVNLSVTFSFFIIGILLLLIGLVTKLMR